MGTNEDRSVAAGHDVDPALWRKMFDQVMARIACRFGRVEPRASARVYLLGLLSQAERKNCWQLAEQAGHARPGPMQRLLRYARWDADAVRDDIRTYAVEHRRRRCGTDAAPMRHRCGTEAARRSAPLSSQQRTDLLTVPEIRHLLTAVFGQPALTAARFLHWSIWHRPLSGSPPQPLPKTIRRRTCWIDHETTLEY
ncbi:transposase [Streptomyces anulatus]